MSYQWKALQAVIIRVSLQDIPQTSLAVNTQTHSFNNEQLANRSHCSTDMYTNHINNWIVIAILILYMVTPAEVAVNHVTDLDIMTNLSLRKTC